MYVRLYIYPTGFTADRKRIGTPASEVVRTIEGQKRAMLPSVQPPSRAASAKSALSLR